jgi:hypothetical protein
VSDCHDRVRQKLSFSFEKGWTFDLHRLDEVAYLYIPTKGWGGYGGAAIEAQESWVTATLEALEGVRASWMGVWEVSLDALPQVIELLEREAT